MAGKVMKQVTKRSLRFRTNSYQRKSYTMRINSFTLFAVLSSLATAILTTKSDASEIQASIRERTLYIQGTSQSDSVGITYDGHTWIVTGIGEVDPLSFDAIDVSLGAGNDSLSFIPRASISMSSLTIDLGAGNDFAEVGEPPYTSSVLGVAGNVRILGGSGDDAVSVFSVMIGGSMEIQTGSADDSLFLNGVSVAGPVNITCDAGNDRVITGSATNSFLSSVAIDTGIGSDLVFFDTPRQAIGGALAIRLGGGVDILSFVLTTPVLGDLILDGGGSYDELWFPDAEFSSEWVTGSIFIQSFEAFFDAMYELW